jgi:Tfp pilus assembly protein PilO
MLFTNVSVPLPRGFMLRSLMPLASTTVLCIGMAVGVEVLCSETAATRLTEAEGAYQAAKDAREKMFQNREIQVRAKAAQQELDSVWKSLPTQKDFTHLALDLSELGRTEGVLIPGMNYTLKPVKEQTFATEATISFQATGSYAAVYRFIHKLEHQSTYLIIEKLDVRRLSQSNNNKSVTNLVSLNVTLTTYLKRSDAMAEVS